MNKSSAQITRIGAYGLILRSNEILLCRLSAQISEIAGQWTLPGGGINFGESPHDAMIREVSEETGLDVLSKGVAHVDSKHVERQDHYYHAVRIIYQTEIVGGTLTNELDGTTDLCRWWPRDQLVELKLVDLAIVGVELAFPLSL